ncbi:hypothetical protein DLP05_043 [Stenotrophomonas phage vB_SmaS_DLP_5]|uniref:Uncharacterized protein n=1 Tax=Stenotrophomonas phage vB_SmaS_DLP_5 TaxID=2044561 RepID=A0A2D2W2G3_9CAUD|nr:hypothetical protein FDJ07_gp042 [Stenotrophomonas phage vB_SmaS_DLP_5]ATS92323.1 hypothetical protein DLP05_043 [Stenotrophomonas phage vB_SmaS_DLP_5]
MEGLNITPMEVVEAEGSKRKYIAIAKTDGGKLFAALDFELNIIIDKQSKKNLPAIGVGVRFAALGGGSWNMEHRDQGSKLPDGMENLEKFFFAVSLPGPVVYTNTLMAEKKIVARLFKWLQLIAEVNKAELLVTEANLQMWFEEKSTGLIDYDPADCQFPNEAWETKKSVAAPVTLMPVVDSSEDEEEEEDDGEEQEEDDEEDDNE